MTYWITQKEPSTLVDGWELLSEAYGSEPFSRRVALDTLEKAYPDLGRENLGRVIDMYVKEGSLRVSEREF